MTILKQRRRSSPKVRGFTRATARNFDDLLTKTVSKEKSYLTTFQAARLLGVTADTVLRWVKMGLIEASRTFGGHYRINAETVDALLEEQKATNVALPFCWEYRENRDEDTTNCDECLAFKARAQYCFELAPIIEKNRSLILQCNFHCVDCSYYRFIKSHVATALH